MRRLTVTRTKVKDHPSSRMCEAHKKFINNWQTLHKQEQKKKTHKFVWDWDNSESPYTVQKISHSYNELKGTNKSTSGLCCSCKSQGQNKGK